MPMSSVNWAGGGSWIFRMREPSPGDLARALDRRVLLGELIGGADDLGADDLGEGVRDASARAAASRRLEDEASGLRSSARPREDEEAG
jgi:hypothetical protein